MLEKMKSSACVILLWCIFANAKEPELPLCPSNIQYLPQNLPMHCRMPTKVDQKNLPYQLPPGYQVLQGMQNMPGVQMPVGLPVSSAAQPVITGLQPPPLPQPMASMPGLTAQMMPQKLPVVVMPYYSPVTSKKHEEYKHSRGDKKHRHLYVSDENSDVDSNVSMSEEEDNARRHRREKRRKLKLRNPMLTPLLQYVTKDGYVIYEKKISNGEARKWLHNDVENDHYKDLNSKEHLRELKKLKFNKIDKQKALQARKKN